MMHFIVLSNCSTHFRTVVHYHGKSLIKQAVNKLTNAIVCVRMAALLGVVQNADVRLCMYSIYVKSRFASQPVLKLTDLL